MVPSTFSGPRHHMAPSPIFLKLISKTVPKEPTTDQPTNHAPQNDQNKTLSIITINIGLVWISWGFIQEEILSLSSMLLLLLVFYSISCVSCIPCHGICVCVWEFACHCTTETKVLGSGLLGIKGICTMPLNVFSRERVCETVCLYICVSVCALMCVYFCVASFVLYYFWYVLTCIFSIYRV